MRPKARQCFGPFYFLEVLVQVQVFASFLNRALCWCSFAALFIVISFDISQIQPITNLWSDKAPNNSAKDFNLGRSGFLPAPKHRKSRHFPSPGVK